MDQIKFKNSLDAFVSENEVIGKLVAKIKALPQFNTLKLDVELTLFVAKCLNIRAKYLFQLLRRLKVTP